MSAKSVYGGCSEPGVYRGIADVLKQQQRNIMTRQRFLRIITPAFFGLAIGFGKQTAVEAAPQTCLALDHPEAQAVMAVQRTFTPELMQLPAILGTAIGVDDAGRAALIIYVDNESPAG